MSDWSAHVDGQLMSLERDGLLRTLRPLASLGGSSVSVLVTQPVIREWLVSAGVIPGNDVDTVANCPACRRAMAVGRSCACGGAAPVEIKLFSGNDYLGLSTHPAVRTAAARAAQDVGMGPRASALVCGYTTAHAELEAALAGLKGTEDALLFPTGFAANLAVPAALAAGAAPGELAIFSDELNHASIVDGIRLAARGMQPPAVHVYRHCDVPHLESMLAASPAPLSLVLTDGLFSMDGDYAPLAQLASLKSRRRFLLAVDDAHASLVCGPGGAGSAAAAGVSSAVDLHIGTLSKAFGSQGGFVASSRAVKSLLVNRGRSGVYSTALAAPAVAAAHAALVTASSHPELRAALWARTAQLSAAIGLPLESPIAALVLGSATQAALQSGRLLARGIHVPAIRPPTVPVGTSRLRVTLSAAHSPAEVSRLAAALASVLPPGGPDDLRPPGYGGPGYMPQGAHRWSGALVAARL